MRTFWIIFPALLLAAALAFVASIPWWRRLNDMHRAGHLISWYWGGIGGMAIALMALIATTGVHRAPTTGAMCVVIRRGGRVRPVLAWLEGCPSRPQSMKNRLRDLRRARCLSQVELADSIEVSRQTIIAMEADKYDPSLPMAYRLAAFFEVAVEDLFFNPWRAEGTSS